MKVFTLLALHSLSISLAFSSVDAADLEKFKKKIEKIENYSKDERLDFIDETIMLGMEYFQRLQWSIRLLEAAALQQGAQAEQLTPAFILFLNRQQAVNNIIENRKNSESREAWAEILQQSAENLVESIPALESEILVWESQKISIAQDERWMDWNEMVLPAKLHLLGLPNQAQKNVKADWEKRAPWVFSGEQTSVFEVLKFVGEELASVDEFLELRETIEVEGLTDEVEAYVTEGIQKVLPDVQKAYNAQAPTEFLAKGSKIRKQRAELGFDLLSKKSRTDFKKTLKDLREFPETISATTLTNIQEIAEKLRENAQSYDKQLAEMVQSEGSIALTPSDADAIGRSWRTNLSILEELNRSLQSAHKKEGLDSVADAQKAIDSFRENLEREIDNPESPWRQTLAERSNRTHAIALTLLNAHMVQRELAVGLTWSKATFKEHLSQGRYHSAWELLESMSLTVQIARKIPQEYLHIDLKNVLDGTPSSPQKFEDFIAHYTPSVYEQRERSNGQKIIQEIQNGLADIESLGSSCSIPGEAVENTLAAEKTHEQLQWQLRDLREQILLRSAQP